MRPKKLAHHTVSILTGSNFNAYIALCCFYETGQFFAVEMPPLSVSHIPNFMPGIFKIWVSLLFLLLFVKVTIKCELIIWFPWNSIHRTEGSIKMHLGAKFDWNTVNTRKVIYENNTNRPLQLVYCLYPFSENLISEINGPQQISEKKSRFQKQCWAPKSNCSV